MSRFVETIKILNGRIYSLKWHNQRINRTLKHFYNGDPINLRNYIDIPDNMTNGLIKCRVLYDQKVEKTEFHQYDIRRVNYLSLVNADAIIYDFKYTDRSKILKLSQGLADDEDILMVRDGYITDTSYCNVALFDGKIWYTPDRPLLQGVRRSQLIEIGKIIPKAIPVSDLKYYKGICLFNAMIGFKKIQLPMDRIQTETYFSSTP